MFMDVKEVLARSRRAKKKSMHFWSLNEDSKSLIDIIKKLPNLVTLIASNALNSLGCKTVFIGLVNEI